MSYKIFILVLFLLSSHNCLSQKSFKEYTTINKSECKFNTNLRGSNINWVDYGDGIFHSFKINPKLEMLINNIGVTSLRFPGGHLAEKYEWSNGIGNFISRGYSKHYNNSLQKQIFGIDEFLQYCKNNNITPVLTMGYKDGKSEQESLNMIEYCLGDSNTVFGKKRIMNGYSDSYSTEYWEIGNEIYLLNSSITNAQKYIAYCNRLAKKIKSKHPYLKIGVNISGNIESWDEVIVSKSSSYIDYFSYHAYYIYKVNKEVNLKIAFDKIESELKYINSLKNINNKKIDIYVTEHNLLPSDGSNFINSRHDINQTIFNLGCLKIFENHGVKFAQKWCLLSYGVLYFADIQNTADSIPTLTISYKIQHHFSKIISAQYYSKKNNNNLIDFIFYDSVTAAFNICLVNPHISDTGVYSINIQKVKNEHILFSEIYNDLSETVQKKKYINKNKFEIILPPLSVGFYQIVEK